jgi:neurofibromin 1
MAPIPESYVLPASKILDESSSIQSRHPSSPRENFHFGVGLVGAKETVRLLHEKSDEVELYTRKIVEYVSASNWDHVLDFLKNEMRTLRVGQPVQVASSQYAVVTDEEKSSLVSLRLIACLWVDAKKLGIILQEVCGSFLHLRRPFQHTIAIVLPLLITRWLEQNPRDFVDLHVSHKRLDGGVDTLFDMSSTMVDSGRLKSTLYPFQTVLLFLLPDVFEVASGMRDAKSSSMIKKISFLEGLRKGLRNRSAAAAYSLVSILRVARHFDLDGDSALLSYALDVQDEVREALFRRFTPGIDSGVFDPGLMSAAVVSLAYLGFDTCRESLGPLCLATNAPQDFKIAFVTACFYFAQQPNSEEYQPLYAMLAVFIRNYLKVSY